MLLERATIKHYRSLDSVDVTLPRLTVLVGANGAGKSDFIDGLRFFRDATVGGPAHAVARRAGVPRPHRDDDGAPWNLSIGLEFDAGDGVRGHLLGLSGQGEAYRVESEAHQSIVNFVDGWRFCAPCPDTLRQSGAPGRHDRLAEDGGNWASVVAALGRTPGGRAALERIAEVMRLALPGYLGVSVLSAYGRLLPRMTLSTGSDAGARPQEFDPSRLSDGTLRIFGLLLALHQRPAPTLLVVEEPERTLHPGVLPALAQAFKEASERTQIIVVTHSPQFVDHFPPDDLRVASREGGSTRISPLLARQAAAVKERRISLQELMSAEGLLAEGPAP